MFVISHEKSSYFLLNILCFLLPLLKVCMLYYVKVQLQCTLLLCIVGGGGSYKI
jgi:hypothetical protein